MGLKGWKRRQRRYNSAIENIPQLYLICQEYSCETTLVAAEEVRSCHSDGGLCPKNLSVN